MSSLKDKFLYKFFPQQLYKKKTYSQYGEDLLIISCMEFLGLKSPKYIDVGSNHPFYLNNTALLFEMGLTGINIEANKTLCSLFKKHRPTDINLNIGVGVMDGTSFFYSMKSNTLSTFSEKEALYYKELGHDILEKILTETKSLATIIKQYNNSVFPEILSIDIEGLDFLILENLDMSKNYPKIICAETCKFSNKFEINNKDQELVNLLISKGYSVFADTFVNTILFKR